MLSWGDSEVRKPGTYAFENVVQQNVLFWQIINARIEIGLNCDSGEYV